MQNVKGFNVVLKPEMSKQENGSLGEASNHNKSESSGSSVETNSPTDSTYRSRENAAAVARSTPPQQKKQLRTVPKDDRSLVEKEQEIKEIFKLDKDPIKALQKALQMPKFFKPQK